MIYSVRPITNYLLFLFIMMFALNCAKNKSGDTKAEKSNNGIETVDELPADTVIDSSKRQADESPEDYQLRLAGENHVKKRTTVNYLYDLNRNLMGEGGIAEVVEFNKAGRRIEHTVYRGINKINYSWKFKYDNAGNVTEFASYDKNNVMQLKKDMKYNKENKLIEADELYPAKGKEINYTYTYNDKGLLVETKGTDTEGKETIEKREYNSFGKVAKISIIGQNSNETAERDMEYNSNGNLIKETVKYPNGIEQVTTYDKYTSVYPQEITTPIKKKTFEYNSSGNVTLDIMYNSEGGRQHKYIVEYDDNGLITKKTRYDGKDRPALVIKYEYEYYK